MKMDKVERAGFWAALRSGAFPTRERISVYLRLLAIANLVGVALAICRAHGWLLPLEPHITTEFMSFYAAGRLVDAGAAAAVYLPTSDMGSYIHSLDIPAGFAAIQRSIAHDPQNDLLGFFYPPVYWLLCAPLGYLGFYQAYCVWVGLGAAAYLALLRCISGRWNLLLPALAYFAAVKNAVVGENAFLSAILVGFGLLFLERRPVLAGVLFGGLCYKPHFLLPIGVFLLAQFQWRALLGMAASAAALCLLAGLLFGWQSWVDYFSIVVPHAEWMFEHHGFSWGIQITPFSTVRLLGGGVIIANIVQAAVMLLTMAALFIIARSGSANLRAAALVASFPLIVSVMLDYDLTICALAMVFLFQQASRSWFLPWEKTMLAAMFLLPLLILGLRTSLGLPVDQLILVGFMLVLLQRLRAERRGLVSI
ncbi:MAG: glycosyltransferase family 87 protein [Acidocella sp.]|nr:glycosyltransferase family 87 protein [Acidocella sp.]